MATQNGRTSKPRAALTVLHAWHPTRSRMLSLIVNALISIVVVLLGAAVWGLSGMFLSIPFIGVLKIIFDRIPEMKPWGRLLGDETPAQLVGIRGQAHRRKQRAAKL